MNGGLASPPPIRLDNLTLGYERHPAVHHVTGTIAPGAMLAVVGPNGAGKSTLLKGIAGLIPPLEGRIDRGGLHPAEIAYLPQQAEIDRSFPISVFDTVLLGRWRRAGAFGGMEASDRAAATEALAAVGLAGFERRRIGTLSAGQFQRVLFARLLVQDAAVLLFDEPFAAMDERTTADLLDLVHQWHGEGRTVLAVVHDFSQVRDHFPETLLLARHPVAWGPTRAVMTAEHLAAARAMPETWADRAPVCARPAA